MSSATETRRFWNICDLGSPDWTRILQEGLGANVIPFQSGQGESSGQLAIFSAGPFRLAYADFPVGRCSYDEAAICALVSAARDLGVDVMRLHSRNPLPRALKMKVKVQNIGTHMVPNLQQWQPDDFEKARRTRNRMARSSLRIERATAADASEIYRLYSETIARHRGSIRYRERYFCAMAERTTLVARNNDHLCGFVSFARRGSEAFYLHGGHSLGARALYPSDQLFYSMIMSAKNEGLTSFDFLPSPKGQRALLRYKEAWGGVTSPFLVSDVSLRRIRGMALNYLRQISEMIPRSVVAWILNSTANRK